jgi:hypothetical protein|tara:strand:+ start:871 stop:2532 length:1662 start_codon:yes stop_codon:yes gene_type:complete
MASEAEIERLYQLFVAKGGGAGTFDNTNLTPKQYSDATASSQLTPLQLAQLQSREHQFNKQSALRSIADEIAANNFSNPYAARGAYSSSLFGSSGLATGEANVGALSNALSAFSTGEKALIFAGVLTATGVDLEQILKIGGLALLGTALFSSLTDHTNNQTANIPQGMADASSLASMNAQFGEEGDPCDEFNQLMGILGGVFDGTLDFIDSTITSIISLINQTGITDLLTSIIAAIGGAGSIVGDVIGAIIQALVGAGVALMKTLSPLVGKIINAMAAMTSQIAKEIAGLIDMAAELIRKALALLLGSAALDPCQSAVLTNTGSLAMKDAVALLKHPMGTGAPGGIGTTVDDRANPDRVNQVMKDVYEKADLAQGVVQSPIIESAKTYVTQDSDLHPKVISEDGVFPDIPTGSTYADMEVHAYKIWTQVGFDWTSRQMQYMVTAKSHERIMATAYKTRDFTGNAKQALKKRLGELIQLNWKHQDEVSALKDNIALSFFYFTPGGKKDASIEDAIEKRYYDYLKPAMERTYKDALAFQESSAIAWVSIDNDTYG